MVYYKIYRLSIYYVTLILLVALPYFIFDGKLFVGGDDTRMMYAYPWEFLKAMSFYSWSNVSSLSYYNPSFHFIPFSLLWEGFFLVIGSRVIINYLAFSLPMILGFVFLKKLLNELLGGQYFWETYLASLFYILSPILIITQYAVFLTPVHLIGMFPIFGYYLVKYIKTKKRKYVFYATCWSVLFSFVMYTFAWIFGVIFPLVVGTLIILLIFKESNRKIIFYKICYFFISIALSQAFWVVPFIMSFIFSSKVGGGNVFSKGITSTFEPTVLATATGNILYPLLNLFHRQIILDFNWQFLSDYKMVYDKILVLNILFPAILAIGLIHSKKFLNRRNYKIYLFFVLSFTTSLYFFTLNISFLKPLFLYLGRIPGFVMFRNYFDKFSIGFVFLYSIVIAISLVVLSARFKEKRIIFHITFFIILLINVMPIKHIVNGPLWRTNNFSKTVEFNTEYLDLVEFIKRKISKDSNILTLPYNAAAYAVIPNNNGKGGFVGTSPLKILTGVNDITGNLSFPGGKSQQFLDFLENHNVIGLQDFLYEHHINYVLKINNLSEELKNGYFFDPTTSKLQKNETIINVLGDKIFISRTGSYVLYKTKKVSPIISGPVGNIKKINDVKYSLILNPNQSNVGLKFFDSFQSSWKIFDADKLSVDKFSDLELLFAKPIFDNTHKPDPVFGNIWTVSNNLQPKKLILYFQPETILFVGILLSFFALLLQLFFIWKKEALKKYI